MMAIKETYPRSSKLGSEQQLGRCCFINESFMFQKMSVHLDYKGKKYSVDSKKVCKENSNLPAGRQNTLAVHEIEFSSTVLWLTQTFSSSATSQISPISHLWPFPGIFQPYMFCNAGWLCLQSIANNL